MTQTIRVQSYKYNGHLHYEWSSQLKVIDDVKIILLGQPGRVLRHYTKGRDFTLMSTCIEVFYFKEHFNCFFNLNEEGGLEYYVNIGLPITYKDNVISYVDLDIDLEKYSVGYWTVVDEDEFLENQVKYGYGQELIEKVENTKQMLLKKIASAEYPFDGRYEKVLCGVCKVE